LICLSSRNWIFRAAQYGDNYGTHHNDTELRMLIDRIYGSDASNFVAIIYVKIIIRHGKEMCVYKRDKVGEK
jgi:hypothetical protein